MQILNFLISVVEHAFQATQWRSLQARARTRQVHPLHQLRQSLPQGQGHPQVRHPQHCRSRRGQRHLRGFGLLKLPVAEIVRKALLLRFVRNPLEGCQEQVQGIPQGQVRFSHLLTAGI